MIISIWEYYYLVSSNQNHGEERVIMKQHADYNRSFMEQGIILVFGPLMYTAGVYGPGIFEGDSEEQLKTIISGDPAASFAKYEYYT